MVLLFTNIFNEGCQYSYGYCGYAQATKLFLPFVFLTIRQGGTHGIRGDSEISGLSY